MYQTWIEVQRRIIFQNGRSSIEPSLPCFTELPYSSFSPLRLIRAPSCEHSFKIMTWSVSHGPYLKYKTKLT